MLNLRQIARSDDGIADKSVTTIALSQFSTLQIARPDIVGDLGAPLTYGTVWTTTTQVATTRLSDTEGQTMDPSGVQTAEKNGSLWAGLFEDTEMRVLDGQNHEVEVSRPIRARIALAVLTHFTGVHVHLHCQRH